jgi:hypothetical protein
MVNIVSAKKVHNLQHLQDRNAATLEQSYWTCFATHGYKQIIIWMSAGVQLTLTMRPSN